ncbi:MAG: Crp/Fnr family transcriptional regulator, partial [Arenimonas sp.]
MLLETSAEAVNRLHALLPGKERKRLLLECELVDLEFGNILCERDEAYRYAYFPMTSFISVVTTLSGHPPLEMGIIGNEGMLGASLALGVIEAPMRA